MKDLILISAVLLFYVNSAAQTSAGETSTIDSTIVTWSVGELAVVNYTGVYPSLSQGVVQPYGIPFAIPSGSTNARKYEEVIVKANELNNTQEQLSMYPNPTDGPLDIILNNVGEDAKLHIMIYDLMGQRVHLDYIQAPNNHLRLDLRHLSSGVYHVFINDGNQLVRRKLIKK